MPRLAVHLPLRRFISAAILAAGLVLSARAYAGDTGPVVSPATDHDALEALNLDAPGMEKVKAAGDNLAAVKQAYLDYRRSACPAKWFVNPSDMPAQASEIDDARGDAVCHHIVRNNYGFKPAVGNMGRVFNWKGNPTPPNSPDFTHEWTWCVISRTEFWKDLADAYWKTHNEKYAQAWVSQLLDFAAKNPVERAAPNQLSLWRTLDASMRMYGSWPYCYFHFINSPAFTPDAQWVYLKSVLDHAHLLKGAVQTPGGTSNWVASQCWGLYAIGVLFPELRESADWREIALNRLMEELNLCVPPDGFEAELSPGYHYFTLNSSVGPMRAAKLNHLSVPSEFRDKLLAMYRAPVWVMNQSGKTVATNDSPICNAAAYAREGVELLGPDPLLEWAGSGGTRGEAPPTSTALPYAGFYAMRGGWKPDDMFLFFRAGPVGIAHQHQDKLEIVLNAWDKTLLFEQGSYSYDHSKWRRYVLGTSSHSTMIVDGNGQNRPNNKAPVTQPTGNPWVATPLFDFVAGTYSGGYQKSIYDASSGSPDRYIGPVDHSVTHTRRIVFFKPFYALVLDTAEGTGKHTFDTLFQLDSPAADVDSSSQAVFSRNAGDVQLALYPLDRDNLKADVVCGQMEPMLGWYAAQHRAIATVRFRKQQEAPARFATFLYPYRGQRPAFIARELARADGIWGCTFHSAMEDAAVTLTMNDEPADLSLASHGNTTTATAVGLVMRSHGADQPFVGAWKLTATAGPSGTFTTDSPTSLVWQSDSNSILFYNAGDKACAVHITAPFDTAASLPPSRWMRVSASAATTQPSLNLFEIETSSNAESSLTPARQSCPALENSFTSLADLWRKP